MGVRLKKSFSDYSGLLFGVVVVFAIAIFVLILYSAYSQHIQGELASALTQSTPEDSNANVTEILSSAGTGISRFNTLFPFLVVGVLAFIGIMALMTESHGSFFFIGIIVLAVAIILAVVFSNVYTTIGDKSEFSSADTDFTIMGWILEYLPFIVLFIFVMVGVILYALPKSPGGGSY